METQRGERTDSGNRDNKIIPQTRDFGKLESNRGMPVTPSDESSLTDEHNPLRTPDQSDRIKQKNGVDIPEDIFYASETFKCIQKEMETIEYLMRVRRDVEQELAGRITSKDHLKSKLEDLLGLEKAMQSKLAYVKVQNDIDLEQLEYYIVN